MRKDDDTTARFQDLLAQAPMFTATSVHEGIVDAYHGLAMAGDTIFNSIITLFGSKLDTIVDVKTYCRTLPDGRRLTVDIAPNGRHQAILMM